MAETDVLDGTAAPANPERMTLSVGPHHPSTHGVLRLVLEVEGENIIKAAPEQGFLHTGIEKNAENLTWQQANVVMDRMDYLAPLNNNLGYVLAAEKLLGLEMSKRVKYVRVIMAELTRINSHMVWLGTQGLDLGAATVFWYTFDLREGILDIFEEVTGERMNPSYFRVGGLSKDIPGHFHALITTWLKKLHERMPDLRNLLEVNPIFLERTQGVGKVTAEQCLDLAIPGPVARGSGIPYDVRKAYPYTGYEDFDFDIPTRTEGDVYARYLVRMAEMEESAKIIRQALEAMPEGPWHVDDPKIWLPPKPTVKVSMEQLIHHFKLVSYGFDVPAGVVYQGLEGPRGEIGFYVVADGRNKPMRVRVRPPSFYLVHALPAMIEGGLIADMVASIGSADPVFGEVDR
ncbi:MAG: NADH dehydrogenase (quinone) subunit D [Symbiobacteriia bacterium]